jgi:UDP-glucose 4-epimerase
MTRALVTGGAGFIGSHIARTLLQRGVGVRVFDNLSSGKEANLAPVREDVEFVHGDVRDLPAVRRAMAGVDQVFHEAAIPSVPLSVADPVATQEVNVNGTVHVLVAARDAGVRRVVLASSCAVYGGTALLPCREDDPPQPLSPYAVHKVSAELLCRVFNELFPLETVCLRYFNVYGPGQDGNGDYAAVVPRFLRALLTAEQPVVYGDGEQTRDFVYVEDVARANLLAADAAAVSGAIINIGSGLQTSLNAMLTAMSQMLQCTVAVVHREPRRGDILHSFADIARARGLLGYEPHFTLLDGLQRTARALDERHGQDLANAALPRT